MSEQTLAEETNFPQKTNAKLKFTALTKQSLPLFYRFGP